MAQAELSQLSSSSDPGEIQELWDGREPVLMNPLG